MRRMLSTKAGATFSYDCPQFTYAVRKDLVEIIYKVKPGVYLVVNFQRVDSTSGMLFVNWGRYWNRITTYIPASIHNEAMLSGAWTSIAQ